MINRAMHRRRFRRATATVAMAVAGAFSVPSSASAALTFWVDPGGWPDQARRDAAVWAAQVIVDEYNRYGDFTWGNPGEIPIVYGSGTPTADAGYGGWGGRIRFGGSWPSLYVMIHESNHWMGSGTFSNAMGLSHNGPKAVAIMEQFDGVGARVNTDGVHFWPYGHNQGNEYSPLNHLRNVALQYAWRQDWGIGPASNPTAWAATAVTLTGSDAANESGFNHPWKWSDNTFAHPNAAYSTGAFSMRTPQGYPSWKFAGNSLTVNPGGRLLYNGWGTTGVVTINNLTVNGGTVRHDQFQQDLFQLASNNIALAGTATFEAANGDIRVLAPVSGAGSLTKTGGNVLTLTGNNTYTGATTVSLGKLVLNNVGLPNTSGVSVNSGATLNARGNVTTGGTLTSSGVVDLVDDGPNTLTVSGGLNLNNSTLNLQLGSTTGDRIVAAGPATVSGTNTVNVTFLPGQSPTAGSAYTLATAAGVAGTLNTRLDSAYSIGGLTIDVPAGRGITSTVLNANGNNLALGSGGLTIASSSASSATVNGGSIQLNGSQSWANNSNTRSLGVASGISAVSGAATLTFNGAGTGGVNLSGPISDGGGPLSLVFNQAGTTTVTGSNSFTGSVAVNAGTVFANPGNAANNRAFSSASGITVNGGATLRAGANGLFGWDGSQDRPITVNAGGSLVALGTATTDVGVGLVTLNGGTLAALGTTASDYGSFRFDQATDKLLVTENSTVSAHRVKFGDPNATIEVAAGKTLNFTGTVMDTAAGGISHLNKSGPGLLSMTGTNTYAGGTVVRGGTLGVTGSINSTAVVSVADGNAATGTLAVGSTGSVTGSEVWFGQSGNAANPATGVGTVAAGGVVNSRTWTGVGRTGNSSSSGTLTLNGGTLNVRTAGGPSGNLEVAVYDAVSGTVNVNANSAVRLQSDASILLGSQNNSGNGTVHQNGGSVTFYSNAGSTVGGTGALTLGAGSSSGVYTYNLNGGTLTTPQVNKTSTHPGARGHFNFNGGTLKAAASNASFMQGLTSAIVNTGGAIVDTNAHSVTIAQPLVHAGAGTDGGLTKLGGGVLTLTRASTYNGNTTITGGTLRLGQLTGGSVAGNAVANYTFDSVAGSTVNNAGTGGAVMNGALAGGASIVPGGRAGNAVSVAGGASVNINNPITDLGNAADWTVSAWVKTATPGASILSKGNGTGWSSGNTIFYLGDGAAGGSGGIPSGVRWGGGFFQGSAAATPVNDNAWHQVTYVNNGGAYGLYVDGVAQPLSPGNAGFGSADVGSVVRLGVTTNTIAADGTANFNGQLDDVQFYNHALAPDQVAALFHGQLSGSLPATTQLSIASGATFDLNGIPQQVASVTGPAGSAVTLGAGQLTVNSPSGDTQFAGTISGPGGSLAKAGNATLTLTGSNTYTGGTIVQAGTLRATRLHENNPVSITGGKLQVIDSSPTLPAHPSGDNAFVSRPSALSIADNGAAIGTRAYAGQLDLTNNDLVFDYDGVSPIADIEDMIRAGFNGGDWLGNGITSSTANINRNFALAVADNARLTIPFGATRLFSGQTVDDTTILVKFTHRIDLDLDGVVTTNDATIFNSNYAEGSPAYWSIGDLDYDRVFTSNDATLFNSFYSEALASVPEPATLGVLALTCFGVLGRRRRHF